jgi:site-specific DNA-methyltransferase (adenine-specific)
MNIDTKVYRKHETPTFGNTLLGAVPLVSEVYLMDNIELMKHYPDKYFDLAVVDPPYGIARFGNRVELSNRLCNSAKLNTWDVKPPLEYFIELFRVSKYQIIWGANNFDLPTTEYFIVWDKVQTVDNFASAEYAWTNVKKPAKIYRHSIHKVMAQRKADGGKIHPTQKPVALYDWIFANYAEEGMKILDTHLGGGSSRISANKAGLHFVACEIDEEYFNKQNKRYEEFVSQARLW